MFNYDFGKSKLTAEARHRRRLAWRNELNLHKTVCSLSGKSVISMYNPEHSPFPIYSKEAWFGDNWNPLDYGQEFDFNRPFFEQFYELQSKVPRWSNIVVSSENSDFCNIIGFCKNCYFLSGSANCEDCMYGSPYHSRNCLDSLSIVNCDYCYECIDSRSLYECFYCQNCHNSSNLEFCLNIQSSKNLFLCVGLKNAEHCILNQKYQPQDYQKVVLELKQKFSTEQLFTQLLELKAKTPLKNLEGYANENVFGDHVTNSKNCQNVFYADKSIDCSYSTQIIDSNDCHHVDYAEFVSFSYECSGAHKSSNLAFCHWCWEISDCLYSSVCYGNTSDCFGCIALSKQQYCILNKQYTKEQYFELIPKIITHMKKTGEWGEFFPLEHSPFAYSQTLAELFYPSKSTDTTPKPFLVTQQEELFYKQYSLPKPTIDPLNRHRNRLSKRNSRILRPTTCHQCQAPMHTTHTESQAKIILCKSCYGGV